MKRFSVLFAATAIVASFVLQGCAIRQYHSQEFAEGQVDLAGLQLYFIPADVESTYLRVVQERTSLSADPTTNVTDVPAGTAALEVPLVDQVSFFGNRISSIFVSSNGTIGMGAAPGGNANLSQHFMQPQVSVAPIEGYGDSGAVTVAQAPGDVISVSYRDVVAGGEAANVKAEFFVTDPAAAKQAPETPNDGDIALTYQDISANANGVYGLSEGFDDATIDTIIEGFGNQAPLSVDTLTGTTL